MRLEGSNIPCFSYNWSLFWTMEKWGGGSRFCDEKSVFSGVFFFLWLEFAIKFTMLSCGLGVEARRERRNSFPRRSPKFGRAECTLAATPSLPKNKKPKKRIFYDGKYHETLSKNKKKHGCSIVFLIQKIGGNNGFHTRAYYI